MQKNSLLLLFLGISFSFDVSSQKTKVEEVKVICENLPFNEKPVVAVAPFKIAVNASVGAGLSDMLMTGC